jgi:hypothetical protein
MPLTSKKDLNKRYTVYKKTFRAYEKEGHMTTQAIMRTAIHHNVSQSTVRNALQVLGVIEKQTIKPSPVCQAQ